MSETIYLPEPFSSAVLRLLDEKNELQAEVVKLRFDVALLTAQNEAMRAALERIDGSALTYHEIRRIARAALAQSSGGEEKP